MFVSIQAGYRHIDCAAIYGNEEEVWCSLRTNAINIARGVNLHTSYQNRTKYDLFDVFVY